MSETARLTATAAAVTTTLLTKNSRKSFSSTRT